MSRPRPIAIQYDVIDGRWYCNRRQPRGWYCRRSLHIDGPCALVPRWWNRSRFARAVRRSTR